MVRGSWQTVLRQVDRLYTEGTSAGWDDGELLSRFVAARGESNLAFESIVQRHGPMVLEVCRRILSDHHDAEDAFQATFLVLARRAGSITPNLNGSLGPWLHQVACRTAQKARVARRRRDVRERRAASRSETTIEAEAPTSLDHDEYRVLHEEVARLPEKYRAAIVLCYFEGLTHGQAAASLRWPVGTVRGYLARARDLLRARLIRRGVAPALAISILDSGLSSAATLAPSLVEGTLHAVVRRAVASSVVALSGAIVRSLALARARRLLLALTLLALGVSGAGLVVSRTSGSADREDPPRQAPAPVAQDAAKPVLRERVDLFGDPLPDGAIARLGTNRFNHAYNVGPVAFTPDARTIISYGGDGLARVWDAATGRLLRSIGGEETHGTRLFALSPDGKQMSSAERSANSDYRLWDFETGRELRRVPVPEPTTYFSLMSCSPDGKTLATALFENAIVFRDVKTFRELRRIRVVSRGLGHLAFSPDGRLLVGTSEDARPHFKGGAMGGAVLPKAMRRDRAAPDPSEKASIRVWDVAKAIELRRFPVEGCHSNDVAFSPDGKTLAAPFCDATIRFYDLAEGKELARMKVDGPEQRSLAFSADGRILASGDHPQPDESGRLAEIHIWDVARRVELRRFQTRDELDFGISLSPDGKAVATTKGKTVRLWNAETGREIKAAPSHRSSVVCLVVSPADQTVITGGNDNAIRRWDPSTGRELSVIGNHPQAVHDLAMTSDGRFLLSRSMDATVRLWDMGGGSKSSRLMAVDPESRGRGLAFSRDGRLSTAAGKIWEVASGREIAKLLDESGKAFRPWGPAAFVPDAAGLVATNGGEIWLFDVASGRIVRKIAAPGFQISSISLSPDSRFLVSGVNDQVRLWHMATGREVTQPTMKHDAGFVVATFSSDGRLLVSGCGHETNEDPSIRVWEVASGQEVRRFNGHRAGVYAVAFFPDGHRIASASADATAMIWDLSASDQAARSHPPRSVNADQHWTELATDANRAYRAIWTLVASPELAVPLLSDRLKPIQSDDPDKDTSIGPIATGETLRRLRAIAVLEKIGTPEARRVLGRLATGLDGARETRDARAAWRRLE